MSSYKWCHKLFTDSGATMSQTGRGGARWSWRLGGGVTEEIGGKKTTVAEGMGQRWGMEDYGPQ